jgi:putative transcriptional regulator
MKSKVLKTIHEAAKGLTAAGVMDKQTMREFDALCLPPIKQFTKEEIKKIREREKASQAVFASYLNITPSTIQSWEQGEKKPSGPALKLLSMVEKKGLAFLVMD